MARYQTVTDGLVRERWARFLGALVGRGKAISVAELDERLAEVAETRRKEGSDTRRAIYAYIAGERTVRIAQAFDIGTSLRELGVAWCSGPLALFAAGYLGMFVADLVQLVADDQPEDALVLLYASEPALGGNAQARELLAGIGARLPRTFDPRRYVNRRALAKVDRGLRFALDIAKDNRDDVHERFRGVLYEIEGWIDYRAPSTIRDAAALLRKLRGAHVALTLSAQADAQLAAAADRSTGTAMWRKHPPKIQKLKNRKDPRK